MPDDVEPAATRWRRLVTDRLDEMQRLSSGANPLDGGFWERRAESYAEGVRLSRAEDDPFLRRLRRVTNGQSTAIDAGAGTGRFAVPLAEGVRHVTAVDPSEAMLGILREHARERGLSNLSVLAGTWEQAEVPPADVAFSSYVLPLVADGAGFVLKLDAAARAHAFLYLGAFTGDAVLDPLWRHFHDAPRAPGATYLDAVALLRELGIEPDVKVVEVPNRRRFETLDDAVEHYRDGLLVPDTPDVRRELEGLLGAWLLGRPGALRSPLRTVPAAIIHWTPGASRG